MEMWELSNSLRGGDVTTAWYITCHPLLNAMKILLTGAVEPSNRDCVHLLRLPSQKIKTRNLDELEEDSLRVIPPTRPQYT